MSWIIDDIDLSTLAFNVENRAAGWKVPAKRGDNLVIPGRNGAQWVPNKPFEVGSIVLSMWAVGALEDGTVPSIGAAKQVRNNLDKLTALFAQSHRLLNVVQISSIAYGIKNFFVNPAFNSVQAVSAPTYRNYIPNPAPRKRVDGTQVTNFFPNPSFNTVVPGTDPTRTNLAPTPHFGYGLGTVVVGPGANLTTVSDSNYTNACLDIVPNGSSTDSSAYPLGTPTGTMARMGWNVGDTYTISADIEPQAVQSGTLSADARSITVAVVRGGVVNNTEFVSKQAPNTAGTITRLSVTFTIPADAEECYIRLVNGSQNANEVFFNNILLEKSNAALSYFDGDFTSNTDSAYSWVGTPGNSYSILVYSKAKLNIPIGYGNLQGGYTLADKNWSSRIPAQVTLIKNFGVDVFFPVELHEENDMHKYFLTQLRASDPDWAMYEGDGGNHCLYRPSKITVTKVINVMLPGNRSMSVFTLRVISNGFVFNVMNNHFRADDTDGTSRNQERIDEAKAVIAWIVANNPVNMTFLGDFNSGTTSAGNVRDIFSKAGWSTLKERGPVTNGQYSSYGGTLNGNWIEDIYTRTSDMGISGSALVLTNGASDHFGWLRTTYVYDTNVALGFSKTYENIFLDPFAKWPRTVPRPYTAYNYYYPNDYENYVVGGLISSTKWVDATNVESTVQSSNATDRSTNPDIRNRVHQIRLTGALAANAAIGNRPALAFRNNETPLYRFKMRRYNNTTTTRNIQVRVSTCTSSGSIGSSGSWQTFAVPSGNATWVDVAYNSASLAEATSTYNYVLIQYRTNEAWSSGDGIVIDNHVVNSKNFRFRDPTGYFANVAGPFWNDESQWLNTGWAGDVNESASSWSINSDNRWVAAAATGPTSAYFAFVQTLAQDSAGTSLSFHSMGFQANGSQTFTIPCATPTYVGQPYILRFNARGIVGQSYKAELLKQNTGDANPVSVGSFDFVGAATSTPGTGLEFTGNFISYTGPTYFPAAGDKIFVRFTTPVSTSGRSVLQTSQIHVTNSIISVSGDTADNVNSQHSWEGERYNSKTLEYRHHAKRVNFNDGHQLVRTMNNVNASFLEMFTLSSAYTPTVRLDPQPLVPGTGYYFGIHAYGNSVGVYTDATNLGNSVVKAFARLEFLDVSNNVVASFTGPTVTLANSASANGVNTGTAINVGVQAPLVSIPGSAVSVRPVVSMATPQRGTGLYFNNVVLVNTPVSAAHLGRATFFKGSTGAGYSWLGDVDDSSSIYTGGLLTRWTSPNGGQLTNTPAVAFKGGPGADGKPELTLSTTLDTLPAGNYLYGTMVSARNESYLNNTYVPGRITVKMQFLNNGTVVNTFDVTTLYGILTPGQNLQGMFNVTGSFNEIRYLFKSTVVAPVIAVNMSNVYLFGIEANMPIQHLNTNKIFNPNFYNLADMWTVQGTLTDLTFDSAGDYSVGLSSDAMLISNRFAVTAGTSLRFATWARNNVSAQIKFYNSSSVLVSSTVPQIASQTDYLDIQASLITVPAGAVNAEVVYSVAAGNAAELRYSYVAEDYSYHEDSGYYNPMDYPYFDGSVRDFFSSTTAWLGDQDDSTSAVLPSIPTGWIYSSDPSAPNINQVLPTKRPPGSSGYVGGLVKALKGTTRTFRTLGVYRTNNRFLSGQISVSALPGATVKISLYQATSATASGSLLSQRLLNAQGSQIFTWTDIPLTLDYVYLEVSYTENENTAGYRVWLDNLSLVMTQTPLDGAYPGYFDGNQGGGGWTGEINNSVSTYYGGGRRAYAEVKEAIDMSSMAGGGRAEFVVNMEVPGSFWEDLVTSTLDIAVTNGDLTDSNGTEFSLDALVGGTAPIDDAVIKIEVEKTVNNLMITDVATGGWLKIKGALSDTTFTIDNGNFTVLDDNGNSLIANVTRGGSNQLVPIVPVSSVKPPALRFFADATSDGELTVTITARRRYVLA